MAEALLWRRPNHLQSYLCTLHRNALPRTSAIHTQASRTPFRSHRYYSASQLARQFWSRGKNLPRSFHPPRRPQIQQLRFQTNKASEASRPHPDPTSQLGSPKGSPAQSLSQRFKKLSREYGWTAVGVYFALSALDFPFCFLAVRMLGTDRIARWEQKIIRGFWTAISMPVPGGEERVRAFFRTIGDAIEGPLEAVGLWKPHAETGHVSERGVVMSKAAGQQPDGAIMETEWSWGVEEAEKAHRDNASLATQLALAYAIHKSFIFVRIPLTAAVLPRVVKTLRGWGWDIGKRTPKPGRRN